MIVARRNDDLEAELTDVDALDELTEEAFADLIVSAGGTFRSAVYTPERTIHE